jgi:hypothetical protein
MYSCMRTRHLLVTSHQLNMGKQFVNSVETLRLGAYVLHTKVAFCLCGIRPNPHLDTSHPASAIVFLSFSVKHLDSS